MCNSCQASHLGARIYLKDLWWDQARLSLYYICSMYVMYMYVTMSQRIMGHVSGYCLICFRVFQIILNGQTGQLTDWPSFWHCLLYKNPIQPNSKYFQVSQPIWPVQLLLFLTLFIERNSFQSIFRSAYLFGLFNPYCIKMAGLTLFDTFYWRKIQFRVFQIIYRLAGPSNLFNSYCALMVRWSNWLVNPNFDTFYWNKLISENFILFWSVTTMLNGHTLASRWQSHQRKIKMPPPAPVGCWCTAEYRVSWLSIIAGKFF